MCNGCSVDCSKHSVINNIMFSIFYPYTSRLVFRKEGIYNHLSYMIKTRMYSDDFSKIRLHVGNGMRIPDFRSLICILQAKVTPLAISGKSGVFRINKSWKFKISPECKHSSRTGSDCLSTCKDARSGLWYTKQEKEPQNQKVLEKSF